MSWKTLPTKLVEISEEERTSMKIRRAEQNNRLVRTSPGNIQLPYAFVGVADQFYNFEFRSDDVTVLTFPKSGTVWMGEVVWGLTHINDIDTMDTTHINSRSFFIDLDFLHPVGSQDKTPLLARFKEACPEGRVEDGVLLQLAKAEKKRRIFKTHLPPQLLNPDMINTCKVVYVARNPKDVLVSLYFFLSNRPDMIVEGGFSQFAETFMQGQSNYAPYWEHLKQAWELRDHPNLHFVFYEEMKADTMKELKKLRTFLNLDLSDEQLARVKEATSFGNMKSRDLKTPLTNMKGSFFRKGTVGDWKNMSSSELDARMDLWIEENSKKVGINFKYEI